MGLGVTASGHCFGFDIDLLEALCEVQSSTNCRAVSKRDDPSDVKRMKGVKKRSVADVKVCPCT